MIDPLFLSGEEKKRYVAEDQRRRRRELFWRKVFCHRLKLETRGYRMELGCGRDPDAEPWSYNFQLYGTVTCKAREHRERFPSWKKGKR